MKLKIEIDCSNAAFEDDVSNECASILEQAARRLRDANRLVDIAIPLFDTWGNRVGTYKFTTR